MNQPYQSKPEFLVFAITPSQVLDNAIIRAKTKTFSIAGEQTYLNHPPHLTLYVSAFNSPEDAADQIALLATGWAQPTAKIVGWHSFAGDSLTGKQTLVCEIDQSCTASLRDMQTELVRRIAPLRNKQASEHRYRPHFQSLAPNRQQAVLDFGFPFIASDWIPHLTIASIEPKKWEAVWSAIKSDAPIGTFRFPKLTIYQLHYDFPGIWREFPLGSLD